jgi:murein L,D-transpeptidase YcbB/YkuD
VKDDSVYITPDDLDQYLSLQQRYQVKIVRPIPLFIQYCTVELENGKLRFYEDVYSKDKEMLRSLNNMNKAPKSDYLTGI